jgi:Zn-dependent protease
MKGFRIGRIYGIDVHVHGSWLVIAGLLMWTLSTTALPADFPLVAAPLRLLMAALITVLFFLSLLAHEMAHSVVAVVRGIPVHRITFFLFGGMAQTSKDSRSAGEEFLIAIAGPAMSVALSAAFLGLWWLCAVNGWPGWLVGTTAYLAVLNAVLAVFNMLPGFPMDGGRVLRAAIWKATGNVTRATRWASRVGQWLAVLLVAYGVWQAFAGDVIGGMWLVLIAMFIRNAARMSYRQHVLGRLHEVAQRAWETRSRQTFDGRGGAGVPNGLVGRDVTGMGGGGG